LRRYGSSFRRSDSFFRRPDSSSVAFLSVTLDYFRRFGSSFLRSDTSFRRFGSPIRRPGFFPSLRLLSIASALLSVASALPSVVLTFLSVAPASFRRSDSSFCL